MIPDNEKSWFAGRVASFRYAINGLVKILSGQHNFRIHLVVGALVVTAGLILELPAIDWCVLILTIALVLSLEAINTALELLVDLVAPEFNEKAGLVKDIAAGAVLISAVAAVIIGIIIFGHKFLNLFQSI